MSFYKPRIGRTNPSGHPIHPGPGDHVASASSADFPQPLDPSLSDATPAAARQADLVCLADIEPRPIDWLWTDRLAAGAVSVLSGDPGSGKTWVALAIAAGLSRGQEPGALSASGYADPCTILYASTANGAAELLRPRFASLEGDPARLILLRGALSAGSAQSAALTLRDTPILEDALKRTGLGCSSSTPCTASWGPMVTVPTSLVASSTTSLVWRKTIAVAFSSFAISASVDAALSPSSSRPRSAPSSLPEVVRMRPPSLRWCR